MLSLKVPLMTATSHALVGAAIVTKIPDLRIAIPLVFILHFAGDKLPHWDAMVNYKTKSKTRLVIESGIDVITGLSLACLIFVVWAGQSPVNILLTAFAAQSPDWLEIPYIFLKWHFFPFDWVYQSQHWAHDFLFDSRAQAPWGVITQVVVVAIFLFWSLT